MTLAKQIECEKRVLREKFKDDPYFQMLEQFYLEMTRKGLVKKPEYSLPLPDTLGSSLNFLRQNDSQSH